MPKKSLTPNNQIHDRRICDGIKSGDENKKREAIEFFYKLNYHRSLDIIRAKINNKTDDAYVHTMYNNAVLKCCDYISQERFIPEKASLEGLLVKYINWQLHDDWRKRQETNKHHRMYNMDFFDDINLFENFNDFEVVKIKAFEDEEKEQEKAKNQIKKDIINYLRDNYFYQESKNFIDLMIKHNVSEFNDFWELYEGERNKKKCQDKFHQVKIQLKNKVAEYIQLNGLTKPQKEEEYKKYGKRTIPIRTRKRRL